jgi:hypothetical protein
MNREGSLWEAARALWMKYCGVADEYKMLRDRWLYASEDSLFGALPYLRSKNKENPSTFDLLDEHIETIDKMFSTTFGFERDNMESFNKEKFKKIKFSDIKIIEDYFYDLSNYVGLLKLGFFQRTVSFEIPHVASGVPHSPERTIGNELFYLAADTVARRYEECLNIPYGKWDGFVTFAPPITEEYFYGAFYRPSPYLELFHISMSEEQKYFVGSYMAIAHEFGHSLMSMLVEIEKNIKFIDAPYWAKILYGNIYNYTKNYFSDFKKDDICRNCKFYHILSNTNTSMEIFFEILCDIVAYMLNGKNYISCLIDQVHGYLGSDVYNGLTNLFRILVINNYCYISKNTDKIKDIAKRIENIAEEVLETYKIGDNLCLNGRLCMIDVSTSWAKLINDFDRNQYALLLIDVFSDIFISNINKKINDILDEILSKVKEDIDYNIIHDIYNSKSIFSFFVVDKFKITKKHEDKIMNALVGGEPCTEEDPRHILHCYYEAYKRSKGEERPNYPATIYSLAFNKFGNNKEE